MCGTAGRGSRHLLATFNTCQSPVRRRNHVCHRNHVGAHLCLWRPRVSHNHPDTFPSVPRFPAPGTLGAARRGPKPVGYKMPCFLLTGYTTICTSRRKPDGGTIEKEKGEDAKFRWLEKAKDDSRVVEKCANLWPTIAANFAEAKGPSNNLNSLVTIDLRLDGMFA